MIRKPVPASSCIRNGPFFEYILGPVFSVVEDKLFVGSHGLPYGSGVRFASGNRSA